MEKGSPINVSKDYQGPPEQKEQGQAGVSFPLRAMRHAKAPVNQVFVRSTPVWVSVLHSCYAGALC